MVRWLALAVLLSGCGVPASTSSVEEAAPPEGFVCRSEYDALHDRFDNLLEAHRSDDPVRDLARLKAEVSGLRRRISQLGRGLTREARAEPREPDRTITFPAVVRGATYSTSLDERVFLLCSRLDHAQDARNLFVWAQQEILAAREKTSGRIQSRRPVVHHQGEIKRVGDDLVFKVHRQSQLSGESALDAIVRVAGTLESTPDRDNVSDQLRAPTPSHVACGPGAGEVEFLGVRFKPEKPASASGFLAWTYRCEKWPNVRLYEYRKKPSTAGQQPINVRDYAEFSQQELVGRKSQAFDELADRWIDHGVAFTVYPQAISLSFNEFGTSTYKGSRSAGVTVPPREPGQ